MAELSGASGVPVATIKYYLREGLLPPGERTGPNQARYDDTHLRRLRLVRAMLEVGGLSISDVRDVLAAMDADDLGPHKIFGVAQATVTQPGLDDDDHSESAERARKRVEELIERLDWRIGEGAPAASALARALVAIEEIQPGLTDQLEARAKIADRVAELDIELVSRQSDLDSQVHVVVVGTVLGDAVAAALRRLAQQNLSARLFDR